MASTARQPPALEEEPLSIDPAEIERAYHRARSRRQARSSRHEFARRSNARFYVVLAVLLFLTVVIALSALREVQHTFGI